MRIRFTGPRFVRRLVGPYEWSKATGFVQDVDARTAAELLTAPEGRFVLDNDEDLLALDGIGPQRAAELALAGIGSLADLTALDRDGERRLAEAVWASTRQIRKWVRSAREQLGLDADYEINQEVEQ